MAQTDQLLALNLGALSAPTNSLTLVWQRLAAAWQTQAPAAAPAEEPTAQLRAALAQAEQSLGAAQAEAESLRAENQALRQANLRLRQRQERATPAIVAPLVPGLASVKTCFPGAVGTVHPQFNQGSCLVGLENLGVHYLLLLKSSFQGQLGETFAHFATQFLQNLVASHKYLSPSELLAHLRQWASQLGPASTASLQATACLVDQQNGEVELAHHGLPVYTQTHQGWPTQATNPGPAEVKLQLQPGQQLLLCTQPLPTQHPFLPPSAWPQAQVWQTPEASQALAPDFLLIMLPF
jgi:hypothetical protein